MRPSRLAYTFLLGAFVSGAARSAGAQSNGDAVYHLHGSVVDGVTGKPVARALVTSTDRRLAVLTDGEGHFSVDLSVPANNGSQRPRSSSSFGDSNIGPTLQLMAQRPNFLLNPQPVNVSLVESLNSKEIILRLMPGGIISGLITAAGAESTRGVQVSLLRRQVIDGAYSWVQMGNQAVRDEGTFRFNRLEPGEYTVMSSEWTNNPALGTNLSGSDAQYPPDFLGDTRSFEGATKLQLHYGEALTAELHLHTAPYFPVRVPVQRDAQSGPMNVRIIGANTFNGFRLGWDEKEGAVAGSLPSGTYTLLISTFGPHPAAVTVPLTIADHALQHAPVTLAAGGEISVRIHREFSAANAANTARPQAGAGISGRVHDAELNLWLRPEDLSSGMGGAGMRTREDGTSVIENTQPGLYFVQANAFHGYIAALSSGNIDLLRAPLSVSDSGAADPIDVTLRDDGATLNGTLDSAGNLPANSAGIWLLPTDGSSQMRQAFTFNSGHFTISDIAPGTYRLLALTQGQQQQQIPYRDPEAMKVYNDKGVLVTLSSGQSVSVHVAPTEISGVTR